MLSREELNPEGPVEPLLVSETFVRVSPVLRLKIGGREIRPTGEHPFYVPGRGWRMAGRLRPGDVVLTMSGEPMAVEAVADTGEVVTVYNFRVAAYHTYFVGASDWGFAVWAHNENGHEAGARPTATDRLKEQLFERPGRPRSESSVRGAQTELEGGQVRAAVERGRTYDHVTKVQNAQQGLLNRMARIRRELSNSSLTDGARQALEAELSEASRLLDATEGFVPRD